MLESGNFCTHFSISSSALYGNDIFPLGGVRGAQHPSCKFGISQIWETIRARKLKFYTPLDGTIPLFGNEFFPPGDMRGAHRP